MKISNLVLLSIATLFLLFVGFQSCTFVIKEGQIGIVSRLGKIQRNADNKLNLKEPGLHFKLPVIEKVKILDARIQTLNTTQAEPFITSEKKELYVDYYVQWRIDDSEKFYLKTQGENIKADNLLRKYIEGSLREQIGHLTIQEIVTGQSNDTMGKDEESGSKREQVMQNALASTELKAKEIGISIIDVRMKQINLPPAVSNSIYQRMSTERHAVAQLHRSQGKKEAEVLKATADREAQVKIYDANRKANEIRSEGDALSTQIYANTYSKSPELFDFLRSMDAYNNSLTSGNNIIVTDENSEFFKYFR